MIEVSRELFERCLTENNCTFPYYETTAPTRSSHYNEDGFFLGVAAYNGVDWVFHLEKDALLCERARAVLKNSLKRKTLQEMAKED